MSAVTVPVLVDDWQIECCGDPPGVGDRVSWQLEWSPHYAGLIPTGFALEARVERGVESPFDQEPGHAPVVVRAGGLTVFASVSAAGPDEVVLRGLLHEDHHVGIPEQVPATTGVVRRVRLVSWAYRETADHSWEPVPGSAQLTTVERSPKWFRTAGSGEDLTRRTTNLLVDLEVD